MTIDRENSVNLLLDVTFEIFILKGFVIIGRKNGDFQYELVTIQFWGNKKNGSRTELLKNEGQMKDTVNRSILKKLEMKGYIQLEKRKIA